MKRRRRRAVRLRRPPAARPSPASVHELGSTTPSEIQGPAIPALLGGRDITGGHRPAPARRPPSAFRCSPPSTRPSAGPGAGPDPEPANWPCRYAEAIGTLSAGVHAQPAVYTLYGGDASAARSEALKKRRPGRRRHARPHHRPPDITVAKKAGNTVSIRQTYAVVPFREKVDALSRILQVSAGDATIVFVRTKGACDEVGAELIARGVSAAAINGDVPQKERERIIERLRTGKLDVLVATDVAARGLDVDRIDLVVNFDAPGEVESYTHRIGRTGRAGRTGEALTFFTPREMSRLRLIERYTKTTLEQITPPSAADVAAHKATKVLDQATERLAVGRLDHYRQAVATYLAQQDLTAAELAATLLALAAGDDGVVAPKQSQASFAAERPERGGEYSARRGDFGRGTGRDDFVNSRAETNRPDRPRKPNATPAGPRYRVAVGHAHGVRPAGIVGAITAEGGLAGRDLGRIDIFDTYSLVEIGGHIFPAAFGRISAAKVSGQSLKIQLDTTPHSGGASSGPRRSGPGHERPARAGYRGTR